eukprot:gene15691-15844_t
MGEAEPLSFTNKELCANSPFAKQLLEIEGVTGVFLGSDFVTITKKPNADWFALKPFILNTLMKLFVNDFPVVLDKLAGDSVTNDSDDPIEMVETLSLTLSKKELFILSYRDLVPDVQVQAQRNIEKTMSAPVTAILGHDMEFYEKLPILFPHADAKSWFTGSPELVETTAFRNGTLQGAYFILAARSLGLDCGPMSGFDNKGVD